MSMKTTLIAKPLTKREIKKAARLYTLMIVAQFDTNGAESEDEIDVISQASDSAIAALNKEFPEFKTFLGTLSQCIDAVKGMRS